MLFMMKVQLILRKGHVLAVLCKKPLLAQNPEDLPVLASQPQLLPFACGARCGCCSVVFGFLCVDVWLLRHFHLESHPFSRDRLCTLADSQLSLGSVLGSVCFSFFFFDSSPEDTLRERNIHPYAFHMRPDQGLSLQSGYAPRPGIELRASQCTGWCSAS